MDELFNFRKNAMLGAANGNPLCQEYAHEWAADEKDKAKLVALSLRQQSIPYFATYCNLGLGLSKDYILSNFGNFINGHCIHDADKVDGYTYGLYVDTSGHFMLDFDVTHVMWCDGLEATIQEARAANIYVSNNSKLNIRCEGFNTLILSIFDNSSVTIEDADAYTKVTARLYSPQATIKGGKFCYSTIKQFQKQLNI